MARPRRSRHPRPDEAPEPLPVGPPRSLPRQPHRRRSAAHQERTLPIRQLPKGGLEPGCPCRRQTRAQNPKRGLVPLLAISAHQVLADSLLAVGPMQKSPATLAVVLDPRTSGSLDDVRRRERDSPFRRNPATSSDQRQHHDAERRAARQPRLVSVNLRSGHESPTMSGLRGAVPANSSSSSS
jgi:hypothetical protein